MPRHPDVGRILPRRRGRAHDGQEPAGDAPQPQNRLRLPELQPAAQDDGHRERRAAAHVQPHVFGRRALPPFGRGAAGSGARRPAAPPQQSDVGRPDAARGHRPGAGQQPGGHPRRRGDGQPRHAHQLRGAGALPAAPCRRPHHHLRNAQPRHRAPASRCWCSSSSSMPPAAPSSS